MIGLLQLNTRFPRPIGDCGNPLSWSEPLRVQIVQRARVHNVVQRAPIDHDVLEDCVTNAQRLIDAGARVVTTSCGFFASAQSKTACRLAKPFLSSSLLLLPHFRAQGIASSRIGILSFDATALGDDHFKEMGVPRPIAIAGLPTSSYLRQCIAADQTSLNLRSAQSEVLELARSLVANHPCVEVIVLECTNLGPYKNAIAEATGCKVFDLVDAVELLS